MPSQTESAEAQPFFDQGLTLVYAFNHEEALRSFLRAAESTRRLRCLCGGVALSVGPNYNLDIHPEREKVGYKAAQEARRLAARAAKKKERSFVEALAPCYSGEDHPDLKKLSLE